MPGNRELHYVHQTMTGKIVQHVVVLECKYGLCAPCGTSLTCGGLLSRNSVQAPPPSLSLHCQTCLRLEALATGEPQMDLCHVPEPLK